MEEMVANNTGDHGWTNLRQLGNGSCEWGHLLERIGHILVEVQRLCIWLVKCQTNWSTCWNFVEDFICATNICRFEFSMWINYYYHEKANTN